MIDNKMAYNSILFYLDRYHSNLVKDVFTIYDERCDMYIQVLNFKFDNRQHFYCERYKTNKNEIEYHNPFGPAIKNRTALHWCLDNRTVYVDLNLEDAPRYYNLEDNNK
jgi:hypothetical protein